MISQRTQPVAIRQRGFDSRRLHCYTRIDSISYDFTLAVFPVTEQPPAKVFACAVLLTPESTDRTWQVSNYWRQICL